MFQENLLPLLISFLLGFLLNSVLYMMPDIVVSKSDLFKIFLMTTMQTMKKMMMTPTLQNYQFFQLPGQQSQEEDPSTLKKVEMTSSSKNISEVRILCWVMTGPQNHYTKVRYQ